MSGTELAYSASCLRGRYALSGTDRVCMVPGRDGGDPHDLPPRSFRGLLPLPSRVRCPDLAQHPLSPVALRRWHSLRVAMGGTDTGAFGPRKPTASSARPAGTYAAALCPPSQPTHSPAVPGRLTLAMATRTDDFASGRIERPPHSGKAGDPLLLPCRTALRFLGDGVLRRRLRV